MVDPPSILLRFFLALAGIVTIGMGGLFLLLSCVITSLAISDSGEAANLWWSIPTIPVSCQIVVWGGRLVLCRPRKDGGLLSPNWLLVTGLALFAMPVVSLATGAFKLIDLPWWFVASLAVLSPVSVYGLSKRVARRRATRASREAPWR